VVRVLSSDTADGGGLGACSTTFPAVVSAPFVATLVDVTGLVIYFGTALVIMKGTLL
jgi:hypothetical protein